MMRRALITGVTGQDGSYMAEFLLEKDYEVFGFCRRSSSTTQQIWRLRECFSRIRLIEGDVTDLPSLQRALFISKPHEVYHFAAQSHVQTSFLEPLHTMEVTGKGTLNFLEAVRTATSASEHTRIYHASSSEQFGNAVQSPQTELTPFAPASPYAAAKVYAHHLAHIYRASYGMFIACGIAYNHESPRRGERFVTRMITQGAVRVKLGKQAKFKLYLPTPIPQRDWMHAKDVVRGAWLMLHHHTPRDFILASGTSRSVQEFGEAVCRRLGLNLFDCIESDLSLKRVNEVYDLRGDASQAKATLGWEPWISFDALVDEMVEAELRAESDVVNHCAKPQA